MDEIINGEKIMDKTDWIIISDNNRLTALYKGKIEAKGLDDMASALHAVWVMEGRKKGHFYIEINGEVFLTSELDYRYD